MVTVFRMLASVGPAEPSPTLFPVAGCAKFAPRQDQHSMNTASSLFLAALIAAFLLVDFVFYDWALSVFLGQRFAAVLSWAAFWR